MIIKYLYNDFFSFKLQMITNNELVMNALKVECKMVI